MASRRESAARIFAEKDRRHPTTNEWIGAR